MALSMKLTFSSGQMGSDQYAKKTLCQDIINPFQIVRSVVSPSHHLGYNGHFTYRMTISQKDAKEIHGLPWAPTFWLGNVGHYAFTCPLGGDDFEVTLRIPRPPEKEEF
ncbi:hypothetical protein CGCA056_v014684 [Colletotrichum aenigma]|uniref:uncharacterized protein n=1 Tax=Colletotrichum aenigma TaxID=1215731 RepID=UPI0018730325|nr:uncharacterized protein CGCA056_v014684 [Colletotrichum aenigma]KAF5502064.1 hypothetical protein CGCA056_v014684 [Colletotrichum aenigma]